MTDLISIFIKAAFGVENKSKRIESLCGGELFDVSSLKGFLRREYPHLTEEKISQVLSLYKDIWDMDPDCSGHANFFYVFVHFVNDKAVLRENQVRVRLEELLRWRQVTCAIGEDLLACAWLAYRFRWSSLQSWNADWNMSCGVDDPDLQYMYGKGLSDLHHHLKASTDVFSLSWICLMNHITHRYKAFGKIGPDKLMIPELYKMVCQAAAIRVALHDFIKDGSLEYDDCPFMDDFNMEKGVEMLQMRINILSSISRRKYGKRPLDYALPNQVNENVLLHLFDGERNLLFSILRAIYRGCRQQEKLTIMLFRYLKTKTAVRRYMVQTNENVGFYNFSNYERRKDLFLEGYPEYEKMLSILPVVEGKCSHHLTYLETRIAPKADIAKMRNSVGQIIFDWTKQQGNDNLSPNIIFHFIKQNEKAWKPFHERHYTLRKTIRRQTLTLMTLRRRMSSLFERMVGVDAANTELDCRPEVFAHAFRYIRLHADDTCCGTRQSLHYTYHAGEDFFDIVDGLRAIEESVRLLGLSRGDRLGHCIALGLDPSAYYSRYEYNVVVKKQYLLDNIVWLLYQAQKYSVGVSSGLRTRLEDKYKLLAYELYQRDVDMNIYYMAMQLRGDDPQMSVLCPSESGQYLLNDWHSCSLDPDLRLTRIRANKEATRLFREYHFHKCVRSTGDRMEVLHVNQEYAQLVHSLQECMMDELNSKGIVIECCPSSNLKIGPAVRYDQQPIFRFCPVNPANRRMSVTINTDDLGIFHTSVDNEYSLLALSALKVKDGEGNPVYQKQDVMQWLDQIAGNGFKYAFRENVRRL